MVFFILFWVLVILSIGFAFFKMTKVEKTALINDLKTPQFIFTIGFLILGSFLTTLGNAFIIQPIKFSGLAIIAIGGVFSFISAWKANKVKSLSIILFVLLAFYLFW